MKPLQDLTVVAVAGSMAGAYCAKMFADGGARVVTVGQSRLSGHQQAYLLANTQPLALADIDFAEVDVTIESSAPLPLVPMDLDEHQHLVRVQISPFGSHGARSHWKGTDLVDYAAGGHAYLYGDPKREPLRGPPDQPAVASGLYGFVGAMAAVIARPRLGRGQTVEISHVQVMLALHQVTLLRWFMTGDVLCRMGNRYTGQGQPNGPYPCSDGWISIAAVTHQQIEGLLAVTGLLHLLEHPDIDSVMDLQHHPQVLDEPLTAWLSTRGVAEVVDLLQALRIPAAPLLNPLEVLDDPQLVDRAFFGPLASNPDVRVPGPPFTFTHEQPRGQNAWQPGDLTAGPLAGLRILDLARVWAGPLCGRILRELGAEVVWVEAPWHRGPKTVPQSMVDATRYFPNDDPGDCQWNRNGHFVKYSLGKQSLALDLQTDAGQRTFTRLVPQFHVVLENFSSRVMPQLGFDEDSLHELNPDLIYLTMPGYGRSGPAEHWLAYGSSVDSHAGLSSLIGYHDQTPWKGGIAWPDPIAGLHAVSAVLIRLWGGLAHGFGGVTIEAAQFESTVAALGDRIVEAQIDGPFQPRGNRDLGYLFQGVYRCSGDDNWVALSVQDDEMFTAVCGLLELDQALICDHDRFDDAIGASVVGRDADELAAALQAVGVPAAKVAKAPDLASDMHLHSRSAWATIDQPEIGAFTTAVTPIALSATPMLATEPAPTFGEHNNQVLLASGFTRTEIQELIDNAIIVTEPPN